MPTILTVIDHYLPSYKVGGPVRSIAGMVESLGDEFQVKILTSDRDLGDSDPFGEVLSGEWTSVGKAKVLYLAPQGKRLLSWKRLLAKTQYDFIYLNSFFSTLSVMTLFLRITRQIPDRPILLAVRGELNNEALSLKWLKKRVYMAFSKSIGFYRGIQFHATSEYEKKEIVSALGIRESFACGSAIHVAPPLPHRRSGIHLEEAGPYKQAGSARIVFLSRVARMKNLDLAIQLLAVQKGKVEFDIWGPLEDSGYWTECQKLIKKLPPNVVVNYQGVASPDEVVTIFSRYHLFLFPTRHENFGHAIYESLCAGCLVLTSDATIWRNLATEQVGWDLPLSDLNGCRDAIADVIGMGAAEFERRSKRAKSFAQRFADNSALVEATRNMFLMLSNETKCH